MNDYQKLDNDDTRFLFLHVPKTAGTMMSTILSNNFGKIFYQDNLVYADISYEPQQTETIFELMPHRCFSSHALRATSLPLESKYPFISISMVRDPRQLAVSCYFDMRNRVAGEQHLIKSTRLGELIRLWRESDFERRDLACSVPQLRWLYPGVANGLEKMEKDIERNRLLLFPVHRFDDAMVCLEQLFPKQFHDCSYSKKENASFRDHELSEEDLEAVSQLPWLSEDYKLLEAANRFLDRQLEDIFPSDTQYKAAKDDFMNRCKMKKMKSDPAKQSLRTKIKAVVRRMM